MLAKNQLLICLLCASCVYAADDVTTKIMPEMKLPLKIESKQETNIEAEKITVAAPLIALVDVQKVINETQVDREHVEGLFEKQQSFQKELQGKGETIQKKEKDLKTKTKFKSLAA